MKGVCWISVAIAVDAILDVRGDGKQSISMYKEG
jgi:hypothetical protein